MSGQLSSRSPTAALSLVTLYYWATPLFALLDLGGGVNLRLAGLEGHPGYRGAYYLLCAACAVAVWRRPGWAPGIGLVEGATTIALLILGVMVPIVTLPATLEAGGPAAVAANLPEAVVNLLLSGTVWIATLYRNPVLTGSRRG